MPKTVKQLTDIAIRTAKPQAKAYKMADGQGLYLEVLPSGTKSWRMKLRFGGIEKRLCFGQWPVVPLKRARELRDEAKALLSSGIDPTAAKKAAKVTARVEAVEAAETFELVAREWFDKYQPNWSPSHSVRIMNRLERDVFPWLGPRPIREIEPPELLKTIQRIEGRGAVETAHRALQNCGQVFRYAVATGRAGRDPSGDLRGAIPPTKEKHHASIIEPKLIAPLLRSIDEYQGSFVVGCALRLAPLLFVRPGELRHAEWEEIDLEAREWRIPAHKMKMREQHIVPLAKQSLEIMEGLRPLTGHGRYLFPSERSLTRPMSENTINGALRRMGYSKDEMTGHWSCPR